MDLRSPRLVIAFGFLSFACHSPTASKLPAGQTLGTKAGSPTVTAEPTKPAASTSPRSSRLPHDAAGKLLGCMVKPDPADIEKRAPTWIAVLPPFQRMAIAEKFVVDSKIPWDEVVLGPFGQVRQAMLSDESKAISNDTDDNAWSNFWMGFLHAQAPIEPFTPSNLPTPAKPHARPHPRHGTKFSSWAGSVHLLGVSNQAGDKAWFMADYHGRASKLWPPSHTRLSHAELTCVRDFSFPTTATASYSYASCLRCNVERVQSEVTIDSHDVTWDQAQTLLSDGKGSYSARWTGLPIAVNAPRGNRPSGGGVTWHDRYFSEFRSDTISGAHLTNTVCKKGIPGSAFLFCAPSEKDVHAMIETWNGATTTWIRSPAGAN